jgi:beta-glucosidase
MSDRAVPHNFSLNKDSFGKDFVWGVSTAAYQIEGGHDVHGKGISIWDTFVSKKGTINLGQHGRDACEFYYRYKEDILLMKAMSIKDFRFSISWTRLLPMGKGKFNQAGIDFYNKVIDFCLECGITPWITLYHWDLPQDLEDKGGWVNRDILRWFEEFVTLCAQSFGNRVKHWMVLNEPMVFTGAGYFLGVHAPGRKGLKNFLPAVHHATLCQGIGGRILRDELPKATIGTTFSCSQITPYSQREKDVRAAQKADALLNRLFIEPLLGLGYPSENLKILKRIEKYMRPEDTENMVFDFDFIGIQNYTREVVRHSYTVPYLQAKMVPAPKRNVKTTLMDWEVYPQSIYAMLEKFNAYKGINKIIITENGAAFEDFLVNGEIHDVERLDYLKSYLQQVQRAKTNGLKADGYFAWTFTDNFEWAEGYFPRFGLVHVDFKTQKRIIKTSGKWFRKFLKD